MIFLLSLSFNNIHLRTQLQRSLYHGICARTVFLFEILNREIYITTSYVSIRRLAMRPRYVEGYARGICNFRNQANPPVSFFIYSVNSGYIYIRGGFRDGSRRSFKRRHTLSSGSRPRRSVYAWHEFALVCNQAILRGHTCDLRPVARNITVT